MRTFVRNRHHQVQPMLEEVGTLISHPPSEGIHIHVAVPFIVFLLGVQDLVVVVRVLEGDGIYVPICRIVPTCRQRETFSILAGAVLVVNVAPVGCSQDLLHGITLQ